MNVVLTFKNLNTIWYYSNLGDNKLYNFEYIVLSEPRGVSLTTHIETKCFTTCDVLRFLISGSCWMDWKQVDKPTKKIFQVDLDSGGHTFMVHENTIYQSYFNRFPLSVHTVSNVLELLKDPIKNYKEITTVKEEFNKNETCSVRFYEPDVLEDPLPIKKNYGIILEKIKK